MKAYTSFKAPLASAIQCGFQGVLPSSKQVRRAKQQGLAEALAASRHTFSAD